MIGNLYTAQIAITDVIIGMPASQARIQKIAEVVCVAPRSTSNPVAFSTIAGDAAANSSRTVAAET